MTTLPSPDTPLASDEAGRTPPSTGVLPVQAGPAGIRVTVTVSGEFRLDNCQILRHALRDAIMRSADGVDLDLSQNTNTKPHRLAQDVVTTVQGAPLPDPVQQQLTAAVARTRNTGGGPAFAVREVWAGGIRAAGVGLESPMLKPGLRSGSHASTPAAGRRPKARL